MEILTVAIQRRLAVWHARGIAKCAGIVMLLVSMAAAVASGVLDPPNMETIEDAEGGGVYLEWASVEGAYCYGIYRSTDFDGVYDLIFYENELSFVDTDVEANTTYYYAFGADDVYGALYNHPDFSDPPEYWPAGYPYSFAPSAAPSPTPTPPLPWIVAANITEGHIVRSAPNFALDWGAVGGASVYHVYRHIPNGNWDEERFGELGTYYDLGSTASDYYDDFSAIEDPDLDHCVCYFVVLAGTAELEFPESLELNGATGWEDEAYNWDPTPYGIYWGPTTFDRAWLISNGAGGDGAFYYSSDATTRLRSVNSSNDTSANVYVTVAHESAYHPTGYWVTEGWEFDGDAEEDGCVFSWLEFDQMMTMLDHRNGGTTNTLTHHWDWNEPDLPVPENTVMLAAFAPGGSSLAQTYTTERGTWIIVANDWGVTPQQIEIPEHGGALAHEIGHECQLGHFYVMTDHIMYFALVDEEGNEFPCNVLEATEAAQYENHFGDQEL